MRGRNNQIFTCCWSQLWWQWVYVLCSIARSNDNNLIFVVWQEVMSTMVDCNEGTEITPSNNQPNFYVALQEQATVAKQQHCQCNDQVLSYFILQDATTTTIFLFVVSQGATTTVDCDECAWLHKQQPTFLFDVDEPHQWLQRRKSPAIILIAMLQQQCQWRNNHFLLTDYKERDNNKATNAREECNNSHATIKCSCCHL